MPIYKESYDVAQNSAGSRDASGLPSRRDYIDRQQIIKAKNT